MIYFFLEAIQSSILSSTSLQNVEPGKGYAADSQMISAFKCFDFSVSNISATRGFLQLQQSMSYKEVQDLFHVDLKASTTIALWKVGGQFSYLKDIQDKDYSFSLSFYHKIQRDVSLDAKSYPPLTQLGNKIYDQGRNPLFRLTCGDKVVVGFQQRALLTMSINLQFRSHVQKTIFKNELKLGYSLFDIALIIQKISLKLNISAKMSLNIYQEGGDPTQLAKAFVKDVSGSYFFLKCSLKDIDSCQSYINGLIDYAKNQFPKQLDIDTGKGFNRGGELQTVSASTIGIKLSSSFLTPQTMNARSLLSDIYFYNDYYNQKLTQVIEGYPVQWVRSSDIFGELNSFLKLARTNIDILLGKDGAITCYEDTQNCPTLASSIFSAIKIINQTNLMRSLKQIQFKYVIPWNSGHQDSQCHQSIYLAGDPNQFSFKVQSSACQSAIHLFNVQKIESELFRMDLNYSTVSSNTYIVTSARDQRLKQCRGSAAPCLYSSDGINYSGELNIFWEGQSLPYYIPIVWQARQQSQFFFPTFSQNHNFSQLLNFTDQTCSWRNYCPVSGNSYPVCGLSVQKQLSPEIYSKQICVSESPYFFGGSVSLNVQVAGKILNITTHASSNCGGVSGSGGKTFSVHCNCYASCSITGSWEVVYEKA